MLCPAGRHSTNHFVGVGIVDGDDFVSIHLLAADSHGLPDDRALRCDVVHGLLLGRRDSGFGNVIAADCEGVEIPQLTGQADSLAIDDDGDFLFAQPTMRS